MPTFYHHHRTAVLASVDVVAAVSPADLRLDTPCAGWTLADLLTHMTAQHHGFAAAARGHGADADVWRTEPLSAAISADPSDTYAVAAHDVLATFAADVVAAVLPLVMGVPDGEFRSAADAPFARALERRDGGGLAAILRHLGRRPDWARTPAR